MTGKERIIATGDDEKLIFTRHGEKMWTRVRIQNGQMVSMGHETTGSVEAELKLLSDWDIQRIGNK